MKAIRLFETGQPLQLDEIPLPQVGPKEILVKIRAAGICHSDVHYRKGTSPVSPLPRTLGHEIAGVVEVAGLEVTTARVGDRVCLHYLVTCGECYYCRSGHEQFCPQAAITGKHVDGGYAEYIAVPARNAVPLPDDVSFEHGAVLMCSSATSFHALRKARLQPGETVAVFGAGGLGMSAIQLARAFGAVAVYAVDISEDKLAMAERFSAIPVDAGQHDPVAEIRRLTGGRGVDVSLELIGLRRTMEQAVESLAILGRAVMVGIASEPLRIDTYTALIGRETEVIGCSDHLLWELPIVVEYARQGTLDLSSVVTHRVPLESGPVNAVMDSLEQFGGHARTVIVP